VDHHIPSLLEVVVLLVPAEAVAFSLILLAQVEAKVVLQIRLGQMADQAAVVLPASLADRVTRLLFPRHRGVMAVLLMLMFHHILQGVVVVLVLLVKQARAQRQAMVAMVQHLQFPDLLCITQAVVVVVCLPVEALLDLVDWVVVETVAIPA
jgi:hypothetical protein